MRKLLLNLQIFDEGAGGEGSGAQGNSDQNAGGNANQSNSGNFSYEQLNEIATARAERAERSALKSYFTQNGLTEEEAAQAIEKFKAEKKASLPDISKVEKERDEALAKLDNIEKMQTLTAKGVKSEDIDYVMFKINNLVDEKTDFKKAMEKYLKDNPRFTSGNSYKFTSSAGNQNNGTSDNPNDSINNAIRMAVRR